MARQAIPHSAASVCKMLGRRVRGLRCSRSIIGSDYPSILTALSSQSAKVRFSSSTSAFSSMSGLQLHMFFFRHNLGMVQCHCHPVTAASLIGIGVLMLSAWVSAVCDTCTTRP